MAVEERAADGVRVSQRRVESRPDEGGLGQELMSFIGQTGAERGLVSPRLRARVEERASLSPRSRCPGRPGATNLATPQPAYWTTS